ncbi:MAG: flagellar biosynthesis anti-sigma factor FlgM [Planctomycetota bacterium]|nr:flagellar biosynthesis anti-sigma factor FlgM [Planctomycetota bacterium]
MKISGYGEFQQMRKLASREDAIERSKKDKTEEATVSEGSGDAVQISDEARRKIKMRQAPEFREAKVADVRERLEDGSLVNPESLRRGVSRMVTDLIANDF